MKGDSSKFIYSIDVNNSVEYFCESASTVSDRLSCALVTTAPLQPAIVLLRSRVLYWAWFIASNPNGTLVKLKPRQGRV